MLINYIQLGFHLNPLACGFLLPRMRLSCSAFRINNLNYIAKLHEDPRSLGISIAVITAVERCEGNQKVPSSGPKKR
jgi:hypothetical protein